MKRQGEDGHPQATGKGLEEILSLAALRGNQLCQHLDSDIQPPELRQYIDISIG